MTRWLIPREEVARRLCAANHRADVSHGGYRPTNVPCAEHLRQAEFYWNLTRPEGASSLAVVIEVARYNATGELG